MGYREKIELKFLLPFQQFLLDTLRIFLLSIKGFIHNNVVLRASALTYFSLMSVVPVVALAFAIARGFGMERLLRKELSTNLSGQEEVINWIIKFANSLLDTSRDGIVTGIGIIILLWAAAQVLSNIEASFNDIWQVKKGRSFSRKMSDYFSLVFIAPVFVILAGSLTVFVTTQLGGYIKEAQFPDFLATMFRILIGSIPYILVWFLFSFIYKVMPNTRVKFRSAIIAGIIAGTIFQFSQWGYLKFQMAMSGYNAVYGSFAALPLFMIWIQIGWLIVLFGAEFAYAVQNFEKFQYQKEVALISPKYRKILSLLVTNHIVKNFANAIPPPDSAELCSKLQMPSRIVRDVINRLLDAGIIAKVPGTDENHFFYLPASDISTLKVADVIEKLDIVGLNKLEIANIPETDKISEIFEQFSKILADSSNNVLVKDL